MSMYKVNYLLLMSNEAQQDYYEKMHTAAEQWWVLVFSGLYAMVEVWHNDRKILAWDCCAGLPKVQLRYGNVQL